MTDRELLELAARAAGIKFDHITNECGLWAEIYENNCYGTWNPLTDDGDVLDQLPDSVECTQGSLLVEGGMLCVCVIKMVTGKYAVWNMHPLRKSWQFVYTLDDCDPDQQVKESLASLKRLFAKEYVFRFAA